MLFILTLIKIDNFIISKDYFMKKTLIYAVIIFIIVFTISSCQDNGSNKNDITNEHDSNKEQETSNNNESDDNSSVEDGQDANASNIRYFNDLKSWINIFYKHMIAFSDRELEEKEFALKGKNFLGLKDKYTDLYIDLDELKKLYLNNVSTPKNSIPDNISEGLIKADEYFQFAMDYRIEALENIILMIENLEKKEDREVGTYTDEYLMNYQNYTQKYDQLAADMINKIQDTLSKIGYQLRFKDGTIVKYPSDEA